MPRTYDQYCPVARTLELIGDRWTALILRELLLGPRRFTDLFDGLPGISTNVLTTRLKELEEDGVVAKRQLPPPAASTVYELTEHAVGLGGVLAAMAQSGMSLLGRPRKTDEVQGRWLVLGLAVTTTVADPDGTSYELRVDDDVVALRVVEGRLHVAQGAAADPVAIITIDSKSLVAVVLGELDGKTALARRRVSVEGNSAAARRLLDAFSGRALEDASTGAR
jgi:DNA-binding HxlR family transcriptional regulator